MPRVATSIVLSASALLLLAWGVQPAVSAPPAVPPPSPLMDALDQAAPVLTDVDREVGRLKERMTTEVAYPPPTRDPFNFGRRPESPRARVEVPIAPPVFVPAPTLPKLVAIVENPSPDGGVVRRAVLADADDVQFFAAGQTAGAFTITSINETSVVLVDRASGTSYSVTLH